MDSEYINNSDIDGADNSEIGYYRLIDNYTVWRCETVEAVPPARRTSVSNEMTISRASPFLRLQEMQALQMKSSKSPDVPVYKKRNLIKNLESLIEELQEKVSRIQSETDEQDLSSSFVPSKPINPSKEVIKEQPPITNGDVNKCCLTMDCQHFEELETLKRQYENLLMEKNHLEEQIVQLRLDKSSSHGTDSEKRVNKLETENFLIQEKLKAAMERLSQMNREKCLGVANRVSKNPSGFCDDGDGGAVQVNHYEAVKNRFEAQMAGVVQKLQERHMAGSGSATPPNKESASDLGGLFKSQAVRQLTDANAVTKRLASECRDIRKEYSSLQNWMGLQLLQMKRVLSDLTWSINHSMEKRDHVTPILNGSSIRTDHEDTEPELDCLNILKNLIQNSTTTNSAEEAKLKIDERECIEPKKRLFEGKGGAVGVICRIRPPIKEDGTKDSVVSYDEGKGGAVQVTYRGRLKTYEVDYVMGRSSLQDDVFDVVKGGVLSCLDGGSTSIFAYGQTGSGKTYTIQGPPGNVGILKRSVLEILNQIQEREDDWTYKITVSLLEIRNEIIRDLLSRDSNNNKLDIKPASDGSISLPGMVQVEINTVDDFEKVLNAGQSNRSAGSANNSHQIISFVVSATSNATKTNITGKLNLIDLAGSDRVEKTGVDAAKYKEFQNINKSLTCLGDVIHALITKQSHIPHRSSKLTYLLQDSLTGKSRIFVIVQLSPVEKHSSETIASLMFAQRIQTFEAPLSNHPSNDSSGKSTPSELSLSRPRRPSTSGIMLLSGERRGSLSSERRPSVPGPTRRPPLSIKMSTPDKNEVKVEGRNGQQYSKSTSVKSTTKR